MTINWPHSRAKFARDHHLEVLLSLLILLPSKMRKHFELDPKRVVLHGFQMPCRGEVMLTCSCYPTSRFVSQRCHETKISQRNATNTEFIWFIWSVCKTKTTRWKSSSDSICRSIASRWIVYKRVTICGIRVNREEFGLVQFRPEGTPIGICICLQGRTHKDHEEQVNATHDVQAGFSQPLTSKHLSLEAELPHDRQHHHHLKTAQNWPLDLDSFYTFYSRYLYHARRSKSYSTVVQYKNELKILELAY